jgi:arylsulfatase A-like enzyme
MAVRDIRLRLLPKLLNTFIINGFNVDNTITISGYSTNLVGKWHLGFFDWDYVPTARGYDTFFGIYMGEGDHWNHSKMGYLDMRRDKEPTWNYTGQHSTDVFTQVSKNL